MGNSGKRDRAKRVAGGIDPSKSYESITGSPRARDSKEERKTAQLCREVRDTLSISIAALDDAALLCAYVADVFPDPDASHLRVLVITTGSTSTDETRDALYRARGALRTEVAAALTRKRVPLISFLVEKELDQEKYDD